MGARYGVRCLQGRVVPGIPAVVLTVMGANARGQSEDTPSSAAHDWLVLLALLVLRVTIRGRLLLLLVVAPAELHEVVCRRVAEIHAGSVEP